MERNTSMGPEVSEKSVSLALAGAIGRDFRTPLNSLLGFLELLGMSDLSDDQQKTFEYVMAGADALCRSADRLWLLCRSVGGGQLEQSVTFDLSELLGTAASEAGADVRIKIDRRVPATLVGDVLSLRQMLSELLDNAMTHSEGPITLRVETSGEVTEKAVPLRVSVFDDGPGLTEDQLAFIEAPLTTLPRSDEGLGLYLVKHVLGQLGGLLVAGPTTEGGPTVSVRLTLGAATSVDGTFTPEAPTAVCTPAGTTQRRLKVLLVEDNAVNLILVARQMKLLGHELHTATRGESGVLAALGGGFDVILMDRHLPDFDGVEATRRIRLDEQAAGRPRTPIIAVTADAMPGHREECLAAGMDAFLVKPLDLDVLGTTLAAFLPPEADDLSVSDHEVVDPAVLHALAERMGAPEMVTELAHAYLSELAGRRLRLQGAIRRSSAEGVMRTAEALRAPSQTVGALRLAELCHGLIEAAREGDTGFAHEKLPLLRETCRLTKTAMAGARTVGNT